VAKVEANINSIFVKVDKNYDVKGVA